MKKVVSFTIEEDLLGKWRKHVDSNSINSSKLIENLIKKHLRKEKK